MGLEVDPYEPCPCGSGKKFKFCCSQKGREGKRVTRALVDGMGGRTARPAKRKMSEMISEMAAGFIWVGDTIEERQSRLNVACTAWNLACGSHEVRLQALERYRKELAQFNPGTSPAELANLLKDVEFLIERKQKTFPDEQRQIVEARVVRNGKKFRIEVISATGL